jgi:hypothetical protein
MQLLKPNHLYRILSFGTEFWYSTAPINMNKLGIYDKRMDAKYPFIFVSLEDKCQTTKTQTIKILTKDGIGYLRINEHTNIEEAL